MKQQRKQTSWLNEAQTDAIFHIHTQGGADQGQNVCKEVAATKKMLKIDL